MTIKIGSKTFSGTSKVFDGTLAKVLQSLAANQAIIAAATVTDLTNNAGGAANGTIPALVLPANFQAGTGDGVAKAEFETAAGLVRDAISEIVAKANGIRAVIPAIPALTDNTGGGAADGTIAALDVSMTGTDAEEALVSADGARAVLTALASGITQANYYVNALAKSVGLTETVNSIGVSADASAVFAAISTGTGDAVGGTDDEEDATISKAEADAAFTVLRDGITELASKLIAVTSGSPVITVVAG